MGKELDKPILNKIPIDGKNKMFRYGMNIIQGWKNTLEVFNIKENNIGPDKNINIFGIFDGHSGKEISKYLSLNFIPELLKNNDFIKNNYRKALKETFINIDLSLRTEEVNNKLIFFSNQFKSEKKKNIKQLYKKIDKNNNLDENDINNINDFMDILDPKNLENVLISDYVGSSGIIVLIINKRTFVANAGNSHFIAINKNLSIINNKNIIKENFRNSKKIIKARVKTLKGIKYGKEEENEDYLYTKGFGDFQYKDNKLINLSEQEISSEPDIYEIQNEDIKFLIIYNYGFFESAKLINDNNNNDRNFEKNIAYYFIKKLKNEQKNISDIISDYFDEYISKEIKNNQNNNTNNLSCIIIDFIKN